MTEAPMTETHKRPLVTWTGLITAAIAFIFPLLADRLILSSMSEAKEIGILTALVWAAFAQTGRAAQFDAAAGNAHVGVYIVTMIWPAFIFCMMGAAAKFGETEHVA